MKHFLIVLLSLLLILSLVFNGCTKEEKHWELEIWSAQPAGGAIYPTSFAIADALDEYDSNITAEVVKSLGGLDNLQSTASFSAKRKETIVFNFSLNTFQIARDGVEPWVDKAYDLMSVIGISSVGGSIVTLDPNITELDDLIGKTVGNYPSTSSASLAIDYWLQAAGIYDQVNVQCISPNAMADALVGGTIDAMIGTLAYLPDQDRWVPSGPLADLCTKDGAAVHPVLITEAEHLTMAELSGQILNVEAIPADSICDGSPEFLASTITNAVYCAWPEADEELIYEFTKFVAEHMEAIRDYSEATAGASERWLVAGFDEETTHPGALRYFKEKGLM